MNARQCSKLLLWTIAFLLFVGCDDSKSPLSDPQNSKADARLVGVWRLRGEGGEATYYHIGALGGNLPSSLMRLVSVTHSKTGELQPPGEMLVFPMTGAYCAVSGSDFNGLTRPKYKVID